MGFAQRPEFSAGNGFGNAGPASSVRAVGVQELAGEEGWLFEDAEFEADGYKKFTTPEGKTVWRRKK